jgi:hypothetical protein
MCVFLQTSQIKEDLDIRAAEAEKGQKQREKRDKRKKGEKGW